ncbi:GMC oxidoreductase [Periconia macrospinosa]|uniref:GMC oxidoreductase n=1 Tax=Periconia macrospinosa TaxID=97972 RepID=A0A2V1DAW5_9PLEO|nr:GMC oxidoreductase [Periconia macrospinosa]
MLPLLLICVGLIAPMLAACSSEQAFDYIIVGGGPAGLLLANKLSADPNITVAVVEAGDEQFDNPNVTDTNGFGAGLGTDIDWSYTSTPQKYVSNRTLVYYAGKALGGTTTINGMTYIRAEKTQIDAWEELGNEGWNWDSLFPYFKSSEHFQPPDADKAANGATFEEHVHGFDGEVSVGWSKYFMKDGIFDMLKKTNENLGIKWNRDVNSGSMPGFTTWPFTLNATTSIRQDAARAYYYPIAKQRPNLHVFLNTTATRIIWDDRYTAPSNKLVATGLEIVPSSTNNTPHTLHLTHELILSAGSLRSPALLEHSGIGNPSILTPLNITTHLPLPSVGANLQDQPNTYISYNSPTTLNLTGYPSFVTFLTASDLFGSSLPLITSQLHSNISTYASLITTSSPPNTTTPEIETRLLAHQIALIFSPNSTIPLAELLWAPSQGAITCVFWNLLPFSRGSVHIDDPDPLKPPAINPNFLHLPIDTLMQSAAAVKVRELFATPPLSTFVTEEVVPGLDVVPEDAGWDDEKWAAWLKDAYQSNHHPVSTTAMRGREWGGVVDTQAKVYGVRNVRVVDAGTLPEQTSGHLMASVYAVAGRVADMIVRGR